MRRPPVKPLQEFGRPTDDDLATNETLDAWLRRNVSTSQHLAGTCKMGPSSDPTAVVDQYCRMHGLQRLRVVDTSVMPNTESQACIHPTEAVKADEDHR
ncbi:MAG: GMC oxidoreductase [Dehalococcoidia bacterium]